MSDHGFDFRNQGFYGEFAEANPLALAHDLIAAEQAHSALELLSRHREDLGEQPQYLILCARAWTELGDFARAQQALLEAVRLAPADPAPLVLLAELLLERGELDRAHRVLSKARALSPQDRAALRVQRALRERRALEAPTESEGPASAAGLSVDAGHEDLIAAAEEQERARLEAPKPARPRSRIGVALALLFVVAGMTAAGLWLESPSGSTEPAPDPEPLEEQLSDPGLASREPPSEATSLQRLPSPLRSTADEPTEPVANGLKSSIPPQKLKTASWKELSRDPVALVIRADQLYAGGHRSRAASLYRRALRLRPGYPAALIGVSRSLLHAKNTRAAMSLATRAIESDAPKTAAHEAMALYLVGRIHYERGERVSARRILREVTTLPDAPPQAWFYLGETLSRDNSRAARQAYQQYLTAVPSGPLAARARKAIR